ncbi:hypothetical protein [Rhodosalinus sp. 5P4]|uniref:hypothetical protein n=1 Tax=Rhodosalinus sp. 5P4 TaxID=3239196 RepID=UPI0035263618
MTRRNRVRPVRSEIRHASEADALPDGAFILVNGAAWRVTGGHLLRPRPRGRVTVPSPRATRAGCRAGLHASAGA